MSINEQDKINEAAEIFKALAHPTRLAMTMGLMRSNGECNVSIMVEKLGLSQPNISQHLTILKNAKVIEGYRNGANICYKVVDERVIKVIKELELI